MAAIGIYGVQWYMCWWGEACKKVLLVVSGPALVSGLMFPGGLTQWKQALALIF